MNMIRKARDWNMAGAKFKASTLGLRRLGIEQEIANAGGMGTHMVPKNNFRHLSSKSLPPIGTIDIKT